VLPFVNMSADADNEFFSDGVSEEILNVLARIPELKVAARTSAFAFKGSSAKIADIARELGVNHVLEGSVRKAGDQVRVTAQLIQTSDGFHLWSETYDRKLDNIFAIQDEIASAIAGQLKVSLGLEAGESGNLTGTSSLEAYEHYLQGMSLWHLRTVASLEQAVQKFESAIELDPEFAKAHAGLALAWAVMPGYKTMDDDEAYRSVKISANRALELDPENVEAMISLALVARFELEWDVSRDLFERAIGLNPSLATAHQWYAGLLEDIGELEASLASYRRAWALDPRSRIIGNNLAYRLWLANRQNEAIKLVEDVTAFAPEFPDAHDLYLLLSIALDQCEQAKSIGHRLAQLLNKTVDSTEHYLGLCPSAGPTKRKEAISAFLSWPAFDFAAPENPSLSYSFGILTLLVELGEFDAGFELLQRSGRDTRVPEVLWLRTLQTENGRLFKCNQRFIDISDDLEIPPPVDPIACDRP
jgi:TolB-like protein/Tfp pilus assembly protein PilF